MFLDLLIRFNSEILPLIYKILFILSPFIIPVILFYMAVKLYVRFIQLRYISKQQPVLLEIKIPKDIQKSPLAMEIVLGAMQQGGASTHTEAYLTGKVPSWFSLELVSIAGEIHFYIWACEKKFKALLEHQIYAQYPTVEIHEVPNDKDYTKQIPYNPKEYGIWGLQFKLAEDDVYPIKTYIDYNMDKDQKDEYRIDPMTAVLEFLGSVGANQQVWLQILIKKHGKEGLKEFRWKEKPDWKKAAEKEIEDIRAEATPETTGDYPGFPNPTKGQIEKIAAIERSIGKMAFDTMIRGMYVAKDGNFNPINISGLIGSMRQYSSNNLNGIKMSRWTDTDIEYPYYKDLAVIFPFLKKSQEALKARFTKRMFNAYKFRSHFYPPYQNHRQNSFILTTEEVATIYHFPGNVSATPTLTKIASKKSGPPANLPIKK